MAPRRPSSARRTGEILAPTDTTGGAAPVYEADDRTYEHRVGGRAGEVISGTQTQAVGARDLRPGSAPGDVSSNHRALRGLGRHDEFFGTGARPDGTYREEHAPTSFTPRMGRAGEVLNPTRGFAEDATPRTRAAVEARLEEEDSQEEDRGWSLDDALAATDVVVDWAANLWSRVTGATAAPEEEEDDDAWDAHEAKLKAARKAARLKSEADADVARQREALEFATNAAAKATAELRQTRYDVSSLFGSDSDSDMVLSGASDDDDEEAEEEAPPPKKRRSLSPAPPTHTAVEAIPPPAEEPKQPPVAAGSVAEPPTQTPVEAPRPAPPPGPPPGLALADFAGSERMAVETPVEPMEQRRSVEGAGLALADAESAALDVWRL